MAPERSEPRLGLMKTPAQTYEFPVDVHWLDGRLTRVSAAGKPDLEVATPPEFKHGIPGVWSPEDLLVGSVATCFAVTLLAVVERRAVPIRFLDVSGTGTVAQRDDGRFGFTEVALDVVVSTEPGCEDELAKAVDTAEHGCLVAASVDFPVRVALTVRVPELVR
jgi:organic hydroperoxide reductase OsmC/OhrA